ncbi:hypothetical protein B0H66DRAFT_626826 [Apodospora peruviana]|uniref:SnoaL-like domain-containing protein n=1 Tax=Apodospora peruviana TaxID=516989 RepID=A0AAE0I2A8_9PEZI|nr:hypothetical protein B0H66DRAFT_626826 [Apodospora peruviana]
MRVSIGSLLLVLQAGSPWAVVAQSSVTTDSLTGNLARLEAVREIKNIQRTFAQLASYGRFKEMASLFADIGVLRWGQGKGDILAESDVTPVLGPAAIETWLRNEAGKMDGISPGSMNAMINEMPLVTLASDGRSAKGRWHCLRFMGDGAGQTRIEGGIFENQYRLQHVPGTGGHEERWKISVLRYYPMYTGNYRDGWKNVGGKSLPVIPYHYTPDEAGTPILQLASNESHHHHHHHHDGMLKLKRAPQHGNDSALAEEELVYRISQLNEEDEVRNLVHSAGYYVDRRMWPDVLDLFASNGTIAVDGQSSAPGRAGIQSVLERMGPAGLSRGILNDHPIYQTTVEVSSDGLTALARGLEIGMVGDSNAKTAEWQFCTFRHQLARDPDTGIWKIASLNYTRLMFADYRVGWANGGTTPSKSTPPPDFLFSILNISSPIPRRDPNWQPFYREGVHPTAVLLDDLQRRLLRSAAFDETEHISSAYGFYIDDIKCAQFAQLHAANGFKSSPGIGWYRTPNRIEKACTQRYGIRNDSTSALRSSVPFHWRIQPVILVSHDGRSTTLRTRNLQTGTGLNSTSGFSGLAGFNGGMYHDQFVLETTHTGKTRRKIWCLTIDEFYWSSGNWVSGWAGVNRTTTLIKRDLMVSKRQNGSMADFPPDVSVKDPHFGNRYAGFMGGPTPTVSWPNILTMWWNYRNPVSGRVPETYWGPGCVPCRNGVRPEWALPENGFEEPPTGPTIVTAMVTPGVQGNDMSSTTVSVSVGSGPEEGVWGYVELRRGDRSGNLMGEALLDNDGFATFSVPAGDLKVGKNRLAVYFAGNDRVKPGRGIVVVDGASG